MKTWQKLLALLLAVMMVLGMAACAKQATDDTTPAETPDTSDTPAAAEEPTPAEEPAEEKEPVVLEWYYRGNGQQKDTDEVEAAVNELLKQYPGLEHVSININCFPSSDYAQQVALSQASGLQMDIVNSVNLDFYKEVANGTWMPMEDYISDELKNALPEWLWEMGTVDGHIYMVPNYQNAFNTQYLIFPKAYMDKYGNYDEMKAILQDESKSLTEKADCLEAYVKAVAEGEGQAKYCAELAMANDSGSMGFGFTTPFDNLGNRFIVEDGSGKVQYALTDDFYKEAYGIYAKWFDKGLFAPDGVTTSWDNYNNAHMMDAVSCVYSPKEMYGSEERVANTYTNQWGFEVVAINIQPYNFIQKNWGAGGNGISSTCQHPEEAATLLEAITSGSEIGKKIYNTMVFGIEGKHYEFEDEANDRIRTFEYDGSQGGVDTSYAGLKWILGNSFYAYKNQAVLDDQYPVAKELNESPDTVASSLIGFTPDTSAVQTQIDQVNAVADEYYATLVRGVLGADGWEAYYNEFVEKLKVAGIDDVIAELQSQLDAFLASK